MIVANPKKESFSFAMAKRITEQAISKNYQIETIDLYRETHQQAFFTADSINGKNITPEMKYFQDKIAATDKLIFVFPYWWGSTPAILKNFIDWNFSQGFGFKYVKSRPVGLLTDKTVEVFTTTGAPSFYYILTGANKRLRKMFQKQIIEFCGMKMESFNIYGGIDKSATNTSDILNKINLK